MKSNEPLKLKNYTTKISVDKTYGEIAAILAEMGAQQVMCDYNGSKVLSAISFRIDTPFGLMAYHLPAKLDKIHKEIQKPQYARLSRTQRNEEQAARIAWRIIKDWIHSQMSLIMADQVEIEQVFLPYMQVGKKGKTLYEIMQADGGLTALGYDG